MQRQHHSRQKIRVGTQQREMITKGKDQFFSLAISVPAIRHASENCHHGFYRRSLPKGRRRERFQ